MNELINDVDGTEVTERLELAVVKEVERLEAIQNKDRIELVHLKDCGYTCICEKGHQVGDLVLFVKYDTVLPKIDMFDFMADSKYRVKPKSFTVRDEEDNVVSKIYSQGIVLPIEIVEKYVVSKCVEQGFMDISETASKFKEGYDLTEDIGVKKYIPPVSGGGSSFGEMRQKGTFPTHIISKTDEVALANKMRALEELQGKAVYITLKIEGSSGTSFLEDTIGELIVCSRNNMLTETETNKFWLVSKKYNIHEMLIKEPWLMLQWELAGPGIQKNKLALTEPEMFIFNMVNKFQRGRLTYIQMLELKDMYDLPLVPFVKCIKNFNMTFDELQQLADVQKYDSGETAEGIVIRPCEPFFSNVLKDWWSFKVINRDYKL